MVWIVLETHPPSPQAVTVKYVAINQDNCVKHTYGGELGGIIVHPVVPELARETKYLPKDEEEFSLFPSLTWLKKMFGHIPETAKMLKSFYFIWKIIKNRKNKYLSAGILEVDGNCVTAAGLFFCTLT